MSDELFKMRLKHMHPLEAGIYINAYKELPKMKNMNMTPNQITTISIIFGVISLYNLWQGNPILTIIFSYISFYYDCMDGLFARKYDMVTQFGDYYDHISDMIQYSLYLFILYYKYNLLDHKIFVGLILLQYVLVNVYLGCVEKIYTSESTSTLVNLRKLCIINPHKNISILKYFSGINNLLLLYVVTYILLNKNNRK